MKTVVQVSSAMSVATATKGLTMMYVDESPQDAHPGHMSKVFNDAAHQVHHREFSTLYEREIANLNSPPSSYSFVSPDGNIEAQDELIEGDDIVAQNFYPAQNNVENVSGEDVDASAEIFIGGDDEGNGAPRNVTVSVKSNSVVDASAGKARRYRVPSVAENVFEDELVWQVEADENINLDERIESISAQRTQQPVHQQVVLPLQEIKEITRNPDAASPSSQLSTAQLLGIAFLTVLTLALVSALVRFSKSSKRPRPVTNSFTPRSTRRPGTILG